MSRLAGFSRISKSRRQSGDAGAARLIVLDKVCDAGSSAHVNDVVARAVMRSGLVICRRQEGCGSIATYRMSSSFPSRCVLTSPAKNLLCHQITVPSPRFLNKISVLVPTIHSTPSGLPLRLQRTMSTSSVSDFPPSAIRPILEEVTSLLKSRGETISIAETAAGGLISSSLLSTPGASKIYKGGLTLYTLPSRIAYAGWTKETIANYSGPTTDIVSGLAKQVRKDLESTYTISESGTAGPTGGSTPNRTPGYVALAVDSDKGTFTRELSTGLGEDRVANMVQFAVEALTLLRDVMNGSAKL
jgi:PncC family amidohydrolase